MCVHTRVCVCMFVFLLFTDTQVGLKKKKTQPWIPGRSVAGQTGFQNVCFQS